MELMHQSGKLLGILHQTAIKAIKKELEKIADKEGYDLAYWNVKLKTTLEELSSDEFKPLKTHIIESDNII